MPEYEVMFTRKLELTGCFILEAQDEEDATTQAENFINDVSNNAPISWNIKPKNKKYNIIGWKEDSDECNDMDINEV